MRLSNILSQLIIIGLEHKSGTVYFTRFICTKLNSMFCATCRLMLGRAGGLLKWRFSCSRSVGLEVDEGRCDVLLLFLMSAD